MEPMADQFPVLKGGRSRLLDAQKFDQVRRVLWRAYQHRALSEEEFGSTLDRLEFDTTALEPAVLKRHRGAEHRQVVEKQTCAGRAARTTL